MLSCTYWDVIIVDIYAIYMINVCSIYMLDITGNDCSSELKNIMKSWGGRHERDFAVGIVTEARIYLKLCLI